MEKYWQQTKTTPCPHKTRQHKEAKTHTRLSTILCSIPQNIEATDPAQVTASGQRGAGVVSQVTSSTVAMDHEVGMIQCLVCQQIVRWPDTSDPSNSLTTEQLCITTTHHHPFDFQDNGALPHIILQRRLAQILLEYYPNTALPLHITIPLLVLCILN